MATHNMGIDNLNDKISLGRHKRSCLVCRHKQREEIESGFIGWRSPAAIAQEYGLAHRSSVYRHANALGPLKKRQRNIRATLEPFIERAEDVDVTASAFVSAVQAYAKINASGEWIDRSETVPMNDLFEHMSSRESKEYAQTGEMSRRVQQALGTTADVGLPRITLDL